MIAISSRTNAVVVAILIGIGSWYWMQIVHECGHIATALLTGGHIERVVLHFFGFSRTDIAPNPHPLAAVWGGPVFGAVLPALVWIIVRQLKLRVTPQIGFFAGFCLIANGAYIGLGSIDGIGDAGDVVTYGSPRWLLWVFGTACFVAGMWIWHRSGLRRGVDANNGPRTSITFASVFAATAMLIVAVA